VTGTPIQHVADDARDGGGVYWDSARELWLDGYPQTLWRRHSDTVHSALVERWLPAGLGSVLKTDLFDEAVSEGLYPALAAKAQRVVGIDDSGTVVAAAQARHPALVGRCADVRDLPFTDGEFDAVLSNSTLDHFDSRDEIYAALGELRRVLRPGGTLALTLDNPMNPIIALSKVLPRRSLNHMWMRFGHASSSIGLLPYYVGATLSIGELRRSLPRLGFDIRESGAIVHAPRVVAAVVADVLQKRGSAPAQRRFLQLLLAGETLSGWPTRYVTGHLVAVRAIRV